jgi:hypothetical protein
MSQLAYPLMDVKSLDALYSLYKFQKLPLKKDGICAYSHINKYFANADIVILDETLNDDIVNAVQTEISNMGYATTVRYYKNIQEAEENLFVGFFDPVNSKKALQKAYDDYRNKVSEVMLGNYEYINSTYVEIETGIVKSDSIIDAIMTDFSTSGPLLMVIEAAAGFGKTSTSYEVLNRLTLDLNLKSIPLFTELSRNRQASIFKYVLYDEINRKFTGISLELVYKHIIEGRIPVIIDGFDELLKSSKDDLKDDHFQDAEPMLETITELLKGEAKILLTTRRTAIFIGDDFHFWVNKNIDNFSCKRYSLSTPTIRDWIDGSREKMLIRAGLNIKSISNPVLLSNLRNLTEEQFQEGLKNIDNIIEDYIIALMNREMTRQELRMTVKEQTNILESIAGYLVNYDITSDTRDSLESILLREKQSFLISILDNYPSENRITLDQLLTKLTMHAFLDKKGDDEQRIGFVNDFILGTFVGLHLKKTKEGWICTERFIDFLLTAYTPRSASTKSEIYDLLVENMFPYLSNQKIIYIDNYLAGGIKHDLKGEFIEDFEFRGNFNFSSRLIDCVFHNCDFYDVVIDQSTLERVHFIGCTFYNCTIDVKKTKAREISFNNCTADPDFLNAIKENESYQRISNSEESDDFEKHVLERFWPAGKERLIPHKRIGTLRLGVPSEAIANVDAAIESLTRRGIIIQERGKYSVELNLQHIIEIKSILGRV